MHYLVYVSAASKPLSSDELNKILSTCRTNNQRNGITGILFYCDGAFMQVLEGDEEPVNATFARIGIDKRHTGVIELARGETFERHFGNWPMDFKKISTKEFSKFSSFAKTGDAEIPGDGLPPSILLLKNFLEKAGVYLAMGMLLSFVNE